MRIRTATLADTEAIRDIYAPFVTGSAATFDTEVPTVEEMRQTIDGRRVHYPWLVAEGNDGVIGYAYGSQHRARPAYRWSVDVSIYIANAFQRQGIGRKLYDSLLPILRRQGFFMAHAGITLPNPASVTLHEAFGFRRVGVFPNVGHVQGAWRDVGWWALQLQPASAIAPPSEPLSFDPEWVES